MVNAIIMSARSFGSDGTSSGIGRATALYFAERGWNVAATMRDPLKADPVLQHPQITLFALDVTNADSIAQAIADTLNCYKKIDVLLNNAGYALFGPIEASDSEQIQQQFATNLFGLIRVTQQILPVMRAAGEGLILNVSSIIGRMALPYTSSYIATKFAVEGLSESMRYELEPFHIRVKLIEPGSINTEFGKGSKQTAVSDPYRASMIKFLGVFAKSNAAGAKPEEVAKVIYRAANDSLGASGLVGKNVLAQALAHPAMTSVVAPTRHPLAPHTNLIWRQSRITTVEKRVSNIDVDP